MPDQILVIEVPAPTTLNVEVQDPSVLEVTYPGPQGPPGPRGETGLPGDARKLHHVHEQTDVSTIWTITHELGWDPPAVAVLTDQVGPVLVGPPQYLIPGQVLRISMDDPYSGTAVC